MTGLLIVGIILLIGVILVQIGKVSQLASEIRGEEEMAYKSDETQGRWLVIFMVLFLIFCVASAWFYKNSMLGYGPHKSASEHGSSIDSLFNTTLFFTGIVFVLTHIALFWFSYKYRRRKGGKSLFLSHNNTLEMVWTGVPFVVMVVLVVQGLIVWNDVMPDVDPDEDYIEVEATGYQFAWDLRYPGADGQLGTRNFRLIDLASNPLGQDWNDTKNIDDFHASELVLPVNRKIRVRITARDVLHNFYLPHFRVKMDAIPGLPTYFIFTPITTTEEYREELSKYPEWQVPADPSDPNGPQKWEEFEYELACAELCGIGHWSMKRVVKIVSEDEYNDWFNQQQSYYAQNIRNTDADPFKGKLLDYEIKARSKELTTDFETAVIQDDPTKVAITLKNVFFETGSAALSDQSVYELNNIVSLLNEYNVSIEVSGHTDSIGETSSNQLLSDARAASVVDYLVSKGINANRLSAVGYGQNRPIGDNNTEAGRQLNRRIEMRITSSNI